MINSVKALKTVGYCRKTKWLNIQYLKRPCYRIRHQRLTLDGVRLKQAGLFVDKNVEEAKMRQYYLMRASRRLVF